MKKLLGMRDIINKYRTKKMGLPKLKFSTPNILTPQVIMRRFLTLLHDGIFPRRKISSFMTAKSTIAPAAAKRIGVYLPMDAIALKMTLDDYTSNCIKKAVKKIIRMLKRQEGNLIIFHDMEIQIGFSHVGREEYQDIIIYGRKKIDSLTGTMWLDINISYQKLKVSE